MRRLVQSILEKKLDEAKAVLAESFADIMEKKLFEIKKMVAAKKYVELSEEDMQINEDMLDEARIRIVAARVRNGKVQRRKKVSNVAGMTLRSGKLTRMSPAERRRRKMGARKAKIKRKSKMSRILQKRKRSMRRRQAMGL